MFGNPRGHLISTIRGGNNSIFSVLKVGFWLKGSYVRICGSSEIGPRMTVLTLRAKLKLYVGQFRPGGALSGTAEINVLKRLGVHVENIAPIWKQQVDMLGFCLWLAFWLGFIQKYSALLCRPKRCGSGGLETADASVRIAIRRRCLLASPAKHAGIHIDDLEYQEGTEKKIKDASLEVTERNRSARRDGRLELRRSQSVLSWHAVNHAHARIFTSPS